MHYREFRCDYCGNVATGIRRSKKYCSDSCKSMASRQNRQEQIHKQEQAALLRKQQELEYQENLRKYKILKAEDERKSKLEAERNKAEASRREEERERQSQINEELRRKKRERDRIFQRAKKTYERTQKDKVKDLLFGLSLLGIFILGIITRWNKKDNSNDPIDPLQAEKKDNSNAPVNPEQTVKKEPIAYQDLSWFTLL
jgi:hypothetical protein